ncbi:MAG: UvrD-helicase domain-containing protein, partial [Acidimicrobiales bacterium]
MTTLLPATGPAPFDPTEPLGEGTTVLEASAGTGKTHTVASLVITEVAAGRPLDQLLVVTFTRKATGTLRERVWQRIAAATDALTPGVTTADDDAVVAHLSDLVALRDEALTEPLPLYCATSYAFARADRADRADRAGRADPA